MSTLAPELKPAAHAPFAVHFKREALKWARTLHIYLSLSAFAMFLFFAVTGVMLTHDSFGLDQMKTSTAAQSFPPAVAAERDQNALVGKMRSAFDIHLPMTQYTDGDDQVEISFAGPARRAQVILHRSDGSAEANFENRGFIGLMADLHKGAETGWVWRGVLDVVSVWIAVSSLTGLIMLLALPKRRRLGLIVAVFGALFALAAYAVYVPR